MGVTAPRGRWVSQAPKLGFVGWFDGIRGLGVAMVLIGHALHEYLESWVTIVDSFFVLSGFLIVTLLLQEARSTGSISLRKFFTRRAVRLLPSVWLFVGTWLVIAAIGEAVGIEGLKFTEVLKDGVAAVTYVYHVFFPNGLYMIHPGTQNQRTMWHLWTLSVEEHFYLVIPGLVLLCVKRNAIKALGGLMALLIVGIGVARLFAYTGPAMSDGTPSGVRLAFLQRPDALMAGVLLAIVNAHLTAERAEALKRPIMRLGYLGFAMWIFALNSSIGLFEKLGLPHWDYLPDRPAEAGLEAMQGHWYWFRFGHTVGIVGLALMALALIRFPGWWLDRFFCWKRWQYLGRMSYTLYVWHALPYLLILSVTNGEDATPFVQLVRTPILVAAAFAISLPVYYKVELKVMGLKLRFASEKETLDIRSGKMVDVDGLADPGGADGAGGVEGEGHR